jgi:TPP-dependent pyruvate/acetoin dehydrogenase alpha subunit
MSDPGTTYRAHEEVKCMRSTQDPMIPIRGLQKNIAEWGVVTEQELKVRIIYETRLEILSESTRKTLIFKLSNLELRLAVSPS